LVTPPNPTVPDTPRARLQRENEVLKAKVEELQARLIAETSKIEDEPEDEVECRFANIDFKDDLKSLLNTWNIERDTNTPDWLIADYLVNCLLSLTSLVNGREIWYGRK